MTQSWPDLAKKSPKLAKIGQKLAEIGQHGTFFFFFAVWVARIETIKGGTLISWPDLKETSWSPCREHAPKPPTNFVNHLFLRKKAQKTRFRKFGSPKPKFCDPGGLGEGVDLPKEPNLPGSGAKFLVSFRGKTQEKSLALVQKRVCNSARDIFLTLASEAHKKFAPPSNLWLT